MELFDRLAESEDEKLMGVFKRLSGPLVQLTLIYPKRTVSYATLHYEAIKIYSEERPTQYRKNKKSELIKFLFLPGFVIALTSCLLAVPYLRKLFKPPNYSEHGVNMNLPIGIWYPIETHEGLMHVLAVLGQLITGGNVALTLGTLEAMLFRVAQAIIFEFKVLQYSLETVFSRARRVYLKRHPGSGGNEVHHKNPEFQKCVTHCIKECIIHHHKILSVLKGFENLIKWPVALAYGIGTGSIGVCLVSVLLAKESGNYENIILFGLLTVVEVLNMFMLSIIGELITSETKSLRDALYFIEWHKLNGVNRRMLLNFQVGVNEPVIMYAGGLVALCMDTFSSIMNSSYSFFNLMNADVGGSKGS
ncbi:hypothetical protein GE061_009819 [Apolygus lucorum]|uniref:Odorant receptor n=1 Tax=Apolygus lucorum TaxID=248454 RepID=A0A6A4K3J7_APOLU|nr:hypothetical protein GE061_009819 [Apolygus lucorum]